MERQPLVSICCITYNHAPFLAQCLEGFLSQQTTFPFEILIHDDASTDGTTDILKSYADRYPQLIIPIIEKENKYSQGFATQIDFFNYRRARGKYIAYCEGDDYWTDPLKLQRQVDFMESHPSYSVCFHRCLHYYVDTGRFEDDNCGDLFNDSIGGIDVPVELYLKKWITQPLTMLFRISSFSFAWQKNYKYYRDFHEIYHLIKGGKGYLFAFVGGVHIHHVGGINGMITKEKYFETSYPIDKELFKKNKRESSLRKNYCYTLQLGVNLLCSKNKMEAMKLSVIEFCTNKKFKTFWKNIIRILYA